MSKVKAPAAPVSAEGPLPGSQTAVPSQGGRAEGALQVSFIRGLISSMRAQTLRQHHFPKAPPSNSITLGVRIQHLSFGGT